MSADGHWSPKATALSPVVRAEVRIVILYTLLTHRGSRVGALVGGLLIVAVGAYFLLRNAFGLAIPDIDWDLVWPVVVIVTGLAILSRAIDQPESPSMTPDRPVTQVSFASDQPGDAD